MKKLLPLLLCYILMTSQVFAISGGPKFGNGGINPVGTYSGVITVTAVKDFTHDNTGANVIDANGQAKFTVDNSTVSLGLFSLGVPTTSVATGAFVQFVNGDVFIGNIVASVDPDADTLAGIVEGTSSYSQTDVSGTTTTTTTTIVENRATGKITAQITNSRQGSIASGRIVGNATLIVNSGGNRVSGSGSTAGALVQNYGLVCTVTGFRQSLVYTSVTSLGLNTSGSN